jgi:N-acetylneuraminic acid mutarotase
MSKMNMIRIYKVLVVTVLFCAANMASAGGGTWTTKADMPTARLCPSTSVVDGKIYAIGGGRGISGPYLSTVEVYDPATDTWTRKVDMSTRRNGHATAVVNGKIYVMGGEPSPQASLATVEEYDPSTDTWTRKADMPTKRTFLSACTVNGKIYTFGGVTAGVSGAEWNPSAVDVYDPATDTWATKGGMPTPTCMAGACAVNGKIYLMGGVRGGLLHDPAISMVEEYDPSTDTWTPKPNMSTARSGLSLSAVGGKIYAIGGGTYGRTAFSTVEEYDPETDSWTTKPDMPTARLGLSTSVVNNRIYAIGGARDWYPATGMSTVEEYDTGLSSSSPDFNGDGIVDAADMCIMVEHWLTEDTLCDIAPPPFGDGIVDVKDLVLLSEHLFEEILPPELVAYWKFDETEGAIAYELAKSNDGYLFGDPVWQSTEGKKDGALQFDGIDDYVLSIFDLNPADGPFSAFAWIKDGSPGQVIISQMDGNGSGETWLGIDPINGCLMTSLVPPPVGRFLPQPLESQFIITDDQWHHVGFVWDGSYRALYVDGAEVAKDASPLAPLKYSNGGIYIGANKNLDVGTFFSGLIDEVRIYDVALTTEKIAVLAQ